jgi:7-alpha-hydroxysteroid dehydrogenase
VILDLFKVTDQVAVVTGAGRGVGAGIAKALAEGGADVVLAARSVDQLEQTAEHVRSVGRRALVVQTDVMQRDQLEHLVAATLEEFGRIDILVNNAGGWLPTEALHTSEAAFNEAFHFNVMTAFLLSRMCVPHMVETAGGGCIINISSRAGSMVQQGFVAYGTVKAALSFMTRQMGYEWAPKVRVNAIELGAVGTEAFETWLSEDFKRENAENTPLKRVGTPQEAGALALYLASPAAAYMTGKVIGLDGGVEHPTSVIPVTPL